MSNAKNYGKMSWWRRVLFGKKNRKTMIKRKTTEKGSVAMVPGRDESSETVAKSTDIVGGGEPIVSGNAAQHSERPPCADQKRFQDLKPDGPVIADGDVEHVKCVNKLRSIELRAERSVNLLRDLEAVKVRLLERLRDAESEDARLNGALRESEARQRSAKRDLLYSEAGAHEMAAKLRAAEAGSEAADERLKREEARHYGLAVRVAERRCVLSSAVHDLRAVPSSTVASSWVDVVRSVVDTLVGVVIDEPPAEDRDVTID